VSLGGFSSSDRGATSIAPERRDTALYDPAILPWFTFRGIQENGALEGWKPPKINRGLMWEQQGMWVTAAPVVCVSIVQAPRCSVNETWSEGISSAAEMQADGCRWRIATDLQISAEADVVIARPRLASPSLLLGGLALTQLVLTMRATRKNCLPTAGDADAIVFSESGQNHGGMKFHEDFHEFESASRSPMGGSCAALSKHGPAFGKHRFELSPGKRIHHSGAGPPSLRTSAARHGSISPPLYNAEAIGGRIEAQMEATVERMSPLGGRRTTT